MNLTGRPSAIGGGHRGDLVAVGVDLEAERAADIRGDDLHHVVGTPSVRANTRWIMCGHWLLV